MTGTVVVTGASTGIGAATALHLDALGWRVLAGVRKEPDGAALRGRAQGALEPVLVDVTDAGSIAALAGRIGDEPLAGLVNNAGVAIAGPMEFVGLDDLRRQFEVNVVGQVAITQALLANLRRARGRVVFMSSVGGRLAQPFVGPYTASKHALEAIADSLRIELLPWGISVSLIEPGAVKTPLWQKSIDQSMAGLDHYPAQALELYGTAVDRMAVVAAEQGRSGVEPEKVAQAVARALTARRPRTRYPVGRDARIAIRAKSYLPDRAVDRLILRITGLPRG
jgi:NAD(P)-dependent dehydrogenase (short-subunit alcohol dehydrogenase family)